MTGLNSNHFDLSWLLRPRDPATFFAADWEQRHLHLPNRGSAYYRDLLSAEALEQFINTADLRYPALQLAKDGRYFAAETYTRDIRHGSELFTRVPDLGRVAAAYRDGATLTLPALHRTWMPLQLLCTRLAEQLDHAVHANAYLTPGNATGFAPHFDVHDVFVLQIAGRKRWSLHDPPTRLPHRSQPFDPNSYRPGKLIATLDLQAGDLLYLPRGYVHSTVTSEEYSAHITIGVSVYTWYDLLRDHVQSAAEDPRLRSALPAGFAQQPEARAALRKGLLSAISECGLKVDADRLLESFLAHVQSARGPRPETLCINTRVIDSQTALRPPAPETYRLQCEAERTVLEFGGARYIMPTAVAPLMEAIVRSGSFRPADLPAAHDEAARLGVSRYLFDIGFLSLQR